MESVPGAEDSLGYSQQDCRSAQRHVGQTIAHQDKADQIIKENTDHQAKWKDDLKEDEEKARQLQEKVEQAEARADRFDLSEALLEIGLVISSVTLLTRSRRYWYLGMVFSLCGIISALSVWLLNNEALLHANTTQNRTW